MEFVTLSSKYQITIPIDICKKINAKPGSRIWVSVENGTIRLIPKVRLDSLYGTVKGIDSTIEREEDDRI